MPGLRFIGADELRAMPWTDAVDALEDAFAEDNPEDVPIRSHLHVPYGELLLMPAHGRGGTGVKLVTLNPRNPDRGLPFVQAVYVLFRPETLEPEAVVDGTALTAVRTAAVSALATRHLARPDARRLVVFGGGTQAESHVGAMRAVREIDDVAIVGGRSDRARRLVERLSAGGVPARLADAGAVADADVVCTCTTSSTPVFDSSRLAAGAHVNAIGAYRPDMRELDSALMARARVFVETSAAAMAEAGDILQAVEEGVMDSSGIAGGLRDVVRGAVRRESPGEITVFKSVGLALEDLVLARAAAEHAPGG